MKYANETPLEDVLKDIKKATKGPRDSGIPIYVDPIGLQEAEKSLTSTITINVENRPLKTTLPLILKQLGLVYYVADGLLIIASAERSMDEELKFVNQRITNDKSDRSQVIVAKLAESVPMLFQDDTPLDGVLKYIKAATKGPADSGIPIYVDPVGLQEAEKSLTSTIRIGVEGVPLRRTLRLLLRQLDLTYYVSDGLLVIVSMETWDREEDSGQELQGVKPVIAFDRSLETTAVLALFNKPMAMPFQNETPLQDVLAYIAKTTKESNKSDIQFYVDRNALLEVEKSMTSTITIGVEGVPLKTTLRLLLRQLGLAYFVKDGVVNVSESDDELFVLDKVPEGASLPLTTKAIVAKLNEPIAIPFGKKTMLKDVVKYITNATKRLNDSGIPIDVVPEGLRQAGKSMTSTVTLDLDTVPLRITLRMLLEQLGLGYYLKDGRLIIDHPASIEKEEKKAGKES